jgi:hypothetical protein
MRLRSGELLQESDICPCRGKVSGAYTCFTGPYRKPAALFYPFRSFLIPRLSSFMAYSRFLISSEENRYGYDYRPCCFDAAQGD